ncbi:DNA integrity scanning protein DisA [Clostridium pasteurianum DSM 525 = ATCC 6013]|uniref:DNA integrity scanning protein DisA n=1 Tax=Clostridium pasteurianum DSM 525 = ATCC 6013 TaxID=1262449 RepID=A0A0H3J925_CLOPA|nr:DNA integrity scanning diadenylate cyclase DisA [Clostridium pasteurianum]AJA49757.1 DNA integrity scanning protein DisA [Clostridium pasteurianum DSM 525 = ATCC 6013]AJA53745.1 DNA integrity scanning protein DisA [Clostridium pasteurianum DSM 525 = ATCC 6013]AOZ76907.1 DNA integrity scanning protein DisA [Clostridium pasteurianum DSM 525 = ATCC 6013]AOZ80704.1 DNA integrity scanning protein DisA [Clostridium pasteurianum]ELP57552.1 DNA integrity scanning protein DisA [Clostridium pasteuria
MNELRLKKDKELMGVLKMMAPGTPLREGLENILRAKTGGLIVLGDNSEILSIMDGGFKINSEYSPSYVYELAKMDGAIVLSSDLRKILSANVQLIPDSSIPTFETGTRHRTAHRVAKQTGNIVVAISQRRNVITIYKDDIKYVLRDSSIILGKANQALQTLEKYVSVLDRVVTNLNLLEFQDLATLFDVVTSIQRTEMVMRIVSEIERYICELGNEGRLISMQLNELAKNVEQDGMLLIRDYCEDDVDYKEVQKVIQSMNSDEFLDLDIISKLIGYQGVPLVDTLISPRGYRMINKIPRIPSNVIENLVKHFKELKAVMEASYEELDNVEGIGEARAKAIKNGLRRLREQFILNKQF